jgi:hypothetical protein
MTKHEFFHEFRKAVHEINHWAVVSYSEESTGPLAGSLQIAVRHRGESAFYGRSLCSLDNEAQTQYALTVQARICAEAVA